uniref:Fibronectin type-III domain-containing protein n=1 Tax=Paramormyrops kingsleyae TaxID=1676925 RepID=A0A3B3RN31_9TELE
MLLPLLPVPCLPRHIKASMDCERATAVVTWDFSPGAMSYVATATATSGHVATCDTTHTNCEMSSLACGERYFVSVLARGETCNSTSKMPRQLMTEPCMPLHVSIQYNPPVGQVYWDTSMGASYYITEAVTSDGFQTSCTTTDNYCALHNMACGREYNITVLSSNQACEDIVTSDPVSQTTEPCPPKHVQARVDCRTNLGHVSWEESDGAVAYLAILDGRDGDSTFCYTTTTSCTLDTLHCGTVYYTRVQSIGETYNSSDSAAYSLLTAPCVPDMWEAQVNCKNDTVLASWNYSIGVESYVLTARGIDGHSTSCITRETYCTLVGLTCGNAYTLSLAVSTHQCSLMSPTEFTLQTKPCPPPHVSVELQCNSRTASVSWRESEGVELYTASAVDSAGMYAEDCNTTGTTCLFANLECGETYTFTVRAYSGECRSQAGETIHRNTEPCQPINVTAQGSCENDTAVLQWAETKGASIYVVSALGDLGYVVDLRTPNTSIPAELPCGQTYNLSVVAWDDYCDSPRSSVLQYRTGPLG